MKILVDADACPRSALQICLKLGAKYGTPVWTIANFDHQIASDHHILVGNSPQEADITLFNLTEINDVVVTQDWGLAAMVLGKKSKCLNPAGWEYGGQRMSFLLEERAMKAKFRRGGGRTKGPKKRTVEADRRFEARLECILQENNPGVLDPLA